MKQNALRKFVLAGALIAVFLLFTIAVALVDVRPIGPDGSEVGFAAINQFVFDMIGVHLVWYQLTDWLGIAAIFLVLAFAAKGLCQMIRGRAVGKVDVRLIALGTLYVLVAACYLLFETFVINCRPVILSGELEASYPSSHVMLVVCVTLTAAKQFHLLFPGRKKLCRVFEIIAWVFAAVTVVGRMLSGVHWFTDIVGGVLASAAMIALYFAELDLLDPTLHPRK